MRKNLNLHVSWYSPENMETLIEDGYLPLLAIGKPEVYQSTPIHFPFIAPRVKNLSLSEYQEYLNTRVTAWRLINTFDVLSHVSCAPRGVVILTDLEDDPYREILREYLDLHLETEVREYEYNRD